MVKNSAYDAKSNKKQVMTSEEKLIADELASALEMLIFCKSYKDSYGKFDGVYEKTAPEAWDKARGALEKYRLFKSYNQ